MARFAQGLLILVAGLCALCSGESTGAGLRVAGARWGVVSVQVASDSVALRLRGGTGQGGPSRGFRSKGSSMKWRHPHSLFCRVRAPPRGPRLAPGRTTWIPDQDPARGPRPRARAWPALAVAHLVWRVNGG